jgi:hypothetical protein
MHFRSKGNAAVLHPTQFPLPLFPGTRPVNWLSFPPHRAYPSQVSLINVDTSRTDTLLWLQAAVNKFSDTHWRKQTKMKNTKQERKKSYNLGKVRIVKHCWVLDPLSLISLKTARYTGKGKRVPEMRSTFFNFLYKFVMKYSSLRQKLARRTV